MSLADEIRSEKSNEKGPVVTARALEQAIFVHVIGEKLDQKLNSNDSTNVTKQLASAAKGKEKKVVKKNSKAKPLPESSKSKRKGNKALDLSEEEELKPVAKKPKRNNGVD